MSLKDIKEETKPGDKVLFEGDELTCSKLTDESTYFIDENGVCVLVLTDLLNV